MDIANVERYVKMERKPYTGSSNRARSASSNRPGSADNRTSVSYARSYASNSASARNSAGPRRPGEAARGVPSPRAGADRGGAPRQPASARNVRPGSAASSGWNGYGARPGSATGARPAPGRRSDGGPASPDRYERDARSERRAASPDRYQRGAQPAPKRRKKDPLAQLIPLGLLVVALVFAFHLASAWLVSTTNRSTYLNNIYVNGIDVNSFSKEEGAEYVRQQIDARLNASYTLTCGDKSWSFCAADFGATIETDALMERAWNIGHVGTIFDRKKAVESLKENPIELEAPLRYDESRIDAFVDEIYDAVYVAPQDATVAMDVDQPYLVSESSRGEELDKEIAREQIISLIETGEGEGELPMIMLDPALSTDSAMESMNLIVEYKTDTSMRGYNSRYNVRKALSYFSPMEVKPGEEVDFNAIVGPRTQERGWMPATEYIDNQAQEGYGGGVCQASSTLYGALLKAGMTIISRYPHSMTVAYVDPSLDAAVTDTMKNLVFRNDTANSIFIFTEVTQEYATVRIYGERPAYRYELESKIVSQDNNAVRVSYIPDKDGKYCYYENETKLYKEGHSACTSEGWIVAYDWDTGAEVSRKQLSLDIYESGTDIYWRGIHSLNEIGVADAASQ